MDVNVDVNVDVYVEVRIKVEVRLNSWPVLHSTYSTLLYCSATYLCTMQCSAVQYSTYVTRLGNTDQIHIIPHVISYDII